MLDKPVFVLYCDYYYSPDETSVIILSVHDSEAEAQKKMEAHKIADERSASPIQYEYIISKAKYYVS